MPAMRVSSQEWLQGFDDIKSSDTRGNGNVPPYFFVLFLIKGAQEEGGVTSVTERFLKVRGDIPVFFLKKAEKA